MGTTGAPYNLRFPELNDAANVPVDMSELATDVAAALGNMVQSGTVSITGGSEIFKAVTITYPKPFKTSPHVVAMAIGTSVFFAYAAATPLLTTAQIGIRKYDASPINGSFQFHWIAVAGQ